MLRLKSFFKVKFRSVVLGCLLYRNRHDIISVYSSIPIETPTLWPRAVMVGPRPCVLLMLSLGMADWLVTCERVLLIMCLCHLPVHVQRGLSIVKGHSLGHIYAELMIGWTTYTPTRLQSVMSQKMVLIVGVAELSVLFQIVFLWGALCTVRMIIDRS